MWCSELWFIFSWHSELAQKVFEGIERKLSPSEFKVFYSNLPWNASYSAKQTTSRLSLYHTLQFTATGINPFAIRCTKSFKRWKVKHELIGATEWKGWQALCRTCPQKITLLPLISLSGMMPFCFVCTIFCTSKYMFRKKTTWRTSTPSVTMVWSAKRLLASSQQRMARELSWLLEILRVSSRFYNKPRLLICQLYHFHIYKVLQHRSRW